jgi:hypothetical protein
MSRAGEGNLRFASCIEGTDTWLYNAISTLSEFKMPSTSNIPFAIHGCSEEIDKLINRLDSPLASSHGTSSEKYIMVI